MVAGVDPLVLGLAVAAGAVAAVVAVLADRWALALVDAPATVKDNFAWRVPATIVAGCIYGALLGSGGADVVAATWSMVLGALLLLVALIDLRTRMIPVAAVVAVVATGFARAATEGALVQSTIGALVAAAVFALLWIAALPLRARAGTTPFGIGDVLLAAGIGAVSGWPAVLPTLFLGAVLGALASIVLLATRSARATDAIPYGVFLCAAALVAEIARP